MARVERLGVWLDGLRIADLERRHWNELRCRYTDDALARWPSNSPVISCSLPLQGKPQDAAAFCRGLLPEGQALQAMATQARLPTYDTFGLLHFGGVRRPTFSSATIHGTPGWWPPKPTV